MAVVAPGAEHVLVVSSDGELFTWGSNAQSQLGVGKQVRARCAPSPALGARLEVARRPLVAPTMDPCKPGVRGL